MNQRVEYIGRMVTIRDGGTPKQFRCVGVSDVLEDCAVLLYDGRFHSKTVPFDRLELVPTQEERTPEHQAGYLAVDYRTSRDEATEWMTFCLMQAAVLFQNVPEGREPCPTCQGGTVRGNVNDGGDCSDCMNTRLDQGQDATRAEVLRILTVRGLREDGPEVQAALAFYDRSLAIHDEMARDD